MSQQQGADRNRQPNSDKRGMSRRSFILGTATSAATAAILQFLPRVEGGYLAPLSSALGPTTALAVEDTETYYFQVVGADQVGIHVADVSSLDAQGSGTPVKGALVTVTSRFNGAQATATTDSKGNVIISLEGLAVTDDDGKLLDDIYQCNAEISVTTPDARLKMRDFSCGLVCLEGASGVVIGTHKLLTAEQVYIERFTFDDWDIHYEQDSFLRSKFNNVDHTFCVRIKGVPSKASIGKVKLTFSDAKTLKQVISPIEASVDYDASNKLATAMINGKFLQTGEDQCLTSDDVIIETTFTVDGTTYSSKAELGITDTPIDETVLNGSLVPMLTDANSIFTFTATGNWPCFNGLSFTIFSPSFPLQVYTSLFATMVGLGVDARTKDDKGRPDGDAWEKDHEGNIKERYNRMYDKNMAEFKRRRRTPAMPFRDKHGVPARYHSFGCVDANVIARVVLGIQYWGFEGQGKDLKRIFSGGVTAEMGIDVKGSYTWEFMAGPVPLYVSISIGLVFLPSFTFKATQLRTTSQRTLELNTLTYSLDDAFAINLKLTFNATFGAGIKGIISGGISATLTIPHYFGWGENGGDKKANPHITIGGTFLLELFVETFLCKLSAQVWSYNDPNWFNNWNTDGESSTLLTGEDAWADANPRFRLTQPDGSYRHSVLMDNAGRVLVGDPVESLMPVSETQLHEAREADAVRTGTEDAGIDEAAESARFVPVSGQEGVFRRDDGTCVHTGMIPRLVIDENGNVSSELVPSKSCNTFTFDEELLTQAEPVEESDEGVAEEDVQPEAEAAEGAIAAQSNDDAGMDIPADELSLEVDANAVVQTESDAEEDVLSAMAVLAPDAATVTEAEEDLDAGVDTVEVTGDANEGTSNIEAQDLEENALAAQADPSPEEDAVASFTGDPLLGFALGAGEEYSYQYVDGKTTGAVCGEPGVAGIHEQNGVVPSVDVVIYDSVFADPRQRIVTLGDTPYLFRVVTVTYPTAEGTYCRSRVVGSRFDLNTRTWGLPKVIEYSSGDKNLPRVDIFDYDFDIVANPQGGAWVQNAAACLVVTGGLRTGDEDGDGPTIHDIVSKPTVAVVLIDENLNVLNRSVRYVDSMYGIGVKHMICNPRIVDGFSMGGTTGVLAYSFMHRMAEFAQDLMTSNASVSFGVGYCYVRDGKLAFACNTSDAVMLSSSVTSMEIVAGDAVAGSYDALLTLLFLRPDGYDVCSATIPSGGTFDDLEIRQNVCSQDSLPEIKPWPHHGSFLYVMERTPSEAGGLDYHLYEGTYDVGSTGQTGFKSRRVDLAGLQGAAFTVSPSGSFLFYYETFRGDPGDDVDPKTLERTSSNLEIYRIMAARFYDGTFTEDFPFCELDHPVDQFVVTSITEKGTTIIANEIYDPDHSLGRMHYISIPHLLSAEVKAFSQMEDFVYSGRECPFQVDMINQGNLPIGGFTLELLDPDRGNEVVSRAHIGQIQPSDILLTASSRDWAESLGMEGDAVSDLKLSIAEEQGMFMPGKPMSYQVIFSIPEDWRSKDTSDLKSVGLNITDAWTPGISTQDDADDGSVAKFFLEEGTQGEVRLHSAQTAAILYDPVESWKKEEGGGGNGGHSDPLPQTSDLSAITSQVGLALGGLGALFAGYSARRTQVEREEREEHERRTEGEDGIS